MTVLAPLPRGDLRKPVELGLQNRALPCVLLQRVRLDLLHVVSLILIPREGLEGAQLVSNFRTRLVFLQQLRSLSSSLLAIHVVDAPHEGLLVGQGQQVELARWPCAQVLVKRRRLAKTRRTLPQLVALVDNAAPHVVRPPAARHTQNLALEKLVKGSLAGRCTRLRHTRCRRCRRRACGLRACGLRACGLRWP